jgi:hypothetical protein
MSGDSGQWIFGICGIGNPGIEHLALMDMGMETINE